LHFFNYSPHRQTVRRERVREGCSLIKMHQGIHPYSNCQQRPSLTEIERGECSLWQTNKERGRMVQFLNYSLPWHYLQTRGAGSFWIILPLWHNLVREEGAVFELFLPLTLSTVERKKGRRVQFGLILLLTPSTVENYFCWIILYLDKLSKERGGRVKFFNYSSPWQYLEREEGAAFIYFFHLDRLSIEKEGAGFELFFAIDI
jgi:hypothetical protein